MQPRKNGDKIKCKKFFHGGLQNRNTEVSYLSSLLRRLLKATSQERESKKNLANGCKVSLKQGRNLTNLQASQQRRRSENGRREAETGEKRSRLSRERRSVRFGRALNFEYALKEEVS
jgi:hypothetical protein